MSSNSLDQDEKEILAAASRIYSSLVMEIWKNTNHEKLAQEFSVKSAIGIANYIKERSAQGSLINQTKEDT